MIVDGITVENWKGFMYRILLKLALALLAVWHLVLLSQPDSVHAADKSAVYVPAEQSKKSLDANRRDSDEVDEEGQGVEALLGSKSSSVYTAGADEDQEEDTKPGVSHSEKKGRLWVSYKPTKNRKLRTVAEILSKNEVFDELVKGMNDAFLTPKVEVQFTDCGEENAYYSADDRQITMCYELFEYMRGRFAEDDELSKEEVIEKSLHAGIFFFLHELGHAFIDVFDLPVTGREEDAVDNLATLLILSAEEDDDDSKMVSAAMDSFWIDGEEDIEDMSFYDEHSLNQQRGYAIMCLMYGSDPGRFSDWIGDDWLPADRAEGCQPEYEKMKRSWEEILKPYQL